MINAVVAYAPEMFSISEGGSCMCDAQNLPCLEGLVEPAFPVSI